MDEVVDCWIDGLVLSEAVTVCRPPDLRVTLKDFVPATSAALAGRTAFASEEVMAAVSVALVIRFQFASTALTVTLNAVPAVWVVGVPLLPVALPGLAVSPGAKTSNFENAPTPTAIEGLVLLVTAA